MRDRFPSKSKTCRICNTMGPTDWHHLISQNRCKEINKPEWIYNRGNIVELCRSCHDETTASLVRKQIEKSKQNPKDMVCFRCGRDSHFAKKCYAKTHVNGTKLGD